MLIDVPFGIEDARPPTVGGGDFDPSNLTRCFVKFKAVTCFEAPEEFIEALNGLRPTWEVRIVKNCFGAPTGSFGPAEMYVQMTDFAKGQQPFVNYNLTGVTIKPGRDFDRAIREMESVIASIIQRLWTAAGSVQVFVVIHASSPDGDAKLFESTTTVRPG